MNSVVSDNEEAESVSVLSCDERCCTMADVRRATMNDNRRLGGEGV